MREMPLSVAIITRNAARTLEKTLLSLPQGAQIVILDSGSNDATKEICNKYKAHFHHRKWDGFGPQRNAATGLCDCPWVLYLDADEWLSPGLKKEIEQAVLCDDPVLGYRMRRLSLLDGKLIKHGDWAADYVTRLVPTRKARWIGDEPHPCIDEKNLTIAKFKSPLMHDPYADYEEYEKKIRTYAKQWAGSRCKAGKKTYLAAALLRSAWRWFRCFILRAGFLDGKQGWRIAAMSAKMVIYKHRELKHLSKNTHS